MNNKKTLSKTDEDFLKQFNLLLKLESEAREGLKKIIETRQEMQPEADRLIYELGEDLTPEIKKKYEL